MKNKNKKVYIILFAFVLVLLGFIVTLNVILAVNSNLCINCHKNKKEKGKNYCSECLLEAKKKLEEQKNEGTENKATGNSDNEEVNLIIDTSSPDPKKPDSKSDKDGKQSAVTTPGTNTTSSDSKKTGSQTDKDNKKKTYNELNYDPADYDDPDDYAEDAWGEDFDDYDEAYDYWEDY